MKKMTIITIAPNTNGNNALNMRNQKGDAYEIGDFESALNFWIPLAEEGELAIPFYLLVFLLW